MKHSRRRWLIICNVSSGSAGAAWRDLSARTDVSTALSIAQHLGVADPGVAEAVRIFLQNIILHMDHFLDCDQISSSSSQKRSPFVVTFDRNHTDCF